MRKALKIIYFLPFCWVYILMGAWHEVIWEAEFKDIPFNYLMNGIGWIGIILLTLLFV